MAFDKKEQKILEHYKMLLENSLFDEYDILAFLIFLRRHLDKNRYQCVAEPYKYPPAK